ncbi:hypothetical protein CEXT_285021 [Caerostris extrusa]|uniref:Uncharacterized protein n=1 Tax=Caerostris extrusa TaxID=172846 RepID=A0AAV4X9J9_CAEEX|nr:hypothetical protein CEXT_285021 [Caerostris extrusa]
MQRAYLTDNSRFQPPTTATARIDYSHQCPFSSADLPNTITSNLFADPSKILFLSKARSLFHLSIQSGLFGLGSFSWGTYFEVRCQGILVNFLARN